MLMLRGVTREQPGIRAAASGRVASIVGSRPAWPGDLRGPLKLVPSESSKVTASAFSIVKNEPPAVIFPPSGKRRARSSKVMPSELGPSSQKMGSLELRNLPGEFRGPGKIAGKKSRAHLWQDFLRTGIVPVAGGPGPEGGFIELQVFGLDATKDHGAQPSVADGQSLGPMFGGLTVEETERVVSCHGRCRGNEREEQGG